MEPLARLWTWTGHAFIPVAVGWAVFVRGGLDGSIPPEGALISRGYWGLLLSLAAAALLAWSCALYARASKRRGGTASLPPNMTFETEANRNTLVSRGTAAIFGLAILCALAVFGVRYGDSRIHAWDGRQPLADGFLTSRRAAYRLGCSHQPCFAAGERLDGSGKPLAGINEYVLYLTDGALVLAAAAALAGGLVLTAGFLTRRDRTPLGPDPGAA